MGGHGGLNILPQKRWNVYNFDNREKVRQDEEAAAREEQLKREQSRKRDTDLRVEQLRQARGLASASASASVPDQSTAPSASPEKSKHINLFEGIRIFDPVDKKRIELGDEKRKGGFKRMKKEPEPPKVVLPEDEKYRLGYGLAGKGVKLPWYLEKHPNEASADSDSDDETVVTTISKKKSIQELREERLKREAREKERERALIKKHKNDRGGHYSTRYASAIERHPDDYNALYNWALVLQESADNVTSDASSPSKDALLEEACRKYDEATHLNWNSLQINF